MTEKVFYPPAFCTEHGIFPATAFGLRDSANVSLLGMMTNCPKCQRASEIVPGTYSTKQDGLNVLIDPRISRQALSAIRDIVARLQKGEIDELQAKSEVESVAPKAASLLDIASYSRTEKLAALALLISIVGFLLKDKPIQNQTDNYFDNSIHISQVVAPTKQGKYVEDLLSSSSLSRVPFPRRKPPEPEQD